MKLKNTFSVPLKGKLEFFSLKTNLVLPFIGINGQIFQYIFCLSNRNSTYSIPRPANIQQRIPILYIFDRPGAAGAVLQTASLLIN